MIEGIKEGLVLHLGANPGLNDIYKIGAYIMGAYLALKDIPMIYGGAEGGCMGAAANGCLEHGGIVIGVMPNYKLWQSERIHPGITKLIDVGSMAERKQVMTDLSFGGLAMPGGLGTLDEIFEFLTSTKLRDVMGDNDYTVRKFRPAGFYSINNYYDDLIKFLDEKCVEEGFLTPDDRQSFIHSDSMEIVDMLQGMAMQSAQPLTV